MLSRLAGWGLVGDCWVFVKRVQMVCVCVCECVVSEVFVLGGWVF